MKKLLKIFLLVFMVVALTGCIKFNMNVEIKADKTMTMNMELLAEEEMFTSMGMTAEEYIDEMKDEILSSEGMEDAKVTPINKTIDGSQWVGVKVEGSTDSTDIDTSIKDISIDGKEGIELTLPMDDLSDEMGAGDLSSLGYSVSQMKKLGIEMNLTVKMPGKATSNVGTVDGNTVTIDLLELMMNGQTEDIVISSPLSSGGGMGTTWLIVVAILVIVGIIAFVVLKKKNATQEIPYDATSLSQPTSDSETSVPISSNEAIDSVAEQAEDTAVVASKAYCPNCGQEISDETTCPKCGFEIKK